MFLEYIGRIYVIVGEAVQVIIRKFELIEEVEEDDFLDDFEEEEEEEQEGEVIFFQLILRNVNVFCQNE